MRIVRRTSRGNILRLVETDFPQCTDGVHGTDAMHHIVFAMRGFGFEIGRRAVERQIMELLNCNAGRGPLAQVEAEAHNRPRWQIFDVGRGPNG